MVVLLVPDNQSHKNNSKNKIRNSNSAKKNKTSTTSTISGCKKHTSSETRDPKQAAHKAQGDWSRAETPARCCVVESVLLV